jgi:hypothetical protein
MYLLVPDVELACYLVAFQHDKDLQDFVDIFLAPILDCKSVVIHAGHIQIVQHFLIALAVPYFNIHHYVRFFLIFSIIVLNVTINILLN